MKKQLVLGALVGAMLFGGAAASPAMAADNLVTNGDFESPVLTNSSYFYAGTALSNWTLSSPNGYNSTGIVWIEQQQSPGAQSANLTGTMSQTITTEVGKTYAFSAKVAAGKTALNPELKGNVPLTMTVSSGGNQVAQQTEKSRAPGNAFGMALHFTATDTTTQISFSTPYMAVGVDDVMVTEIPVNDSPIILPAIAGGLGLAALGATGLAVGRKKFANK